MNGNPYETGLDKNAANYVPLSPIGFLRRIGRGLSEPHLGRSTASAATPGGRAWNAAAGSPRRSTAPASGAATRWR